MIGRTLAHYRVEEELGSGGMGVVYLAYDTKLDRHVALKLLPADLVDGKRRARFRREAQAIAALDHPNIVAVHGLEEVDDRHFIVMELVRGRRLSDLIPTHGVPIEQFFQLAIPLVDAVAAAHEGGFTHRDLKPDNVMVTNDGVLKVLDFGLALATRRDVSEPGLAISSLPTAVRTEEGAILGTLPYLSPEQAEGRAADSRSDVFALGVIFYEMLTGERPFAGKSATGVLASILRDEPAFVSDVRATVPEELSRIVRRALQKEPRRRYQSARDLANDLTELEERSRSKAPGAKRVTVRRGSAAVALLAAFALGLAAIVAILASNREGGPGQLKMSIVLEPDLRDGPRDTFTLSPDGNSLVYPALDDDGEERLFVRRLDEWTARAIPGTEGAADPFFSPDGKAIGFFAGNQLRTVSLESGVSRTLAEAPNQRGGAWLDDGTIVFAPRTDTPLFSVPAVGGRAEPRTSLSKGERTHRFPDRVSSGAVIYRAEPDTGIVIEDLIAHRRGVVSTTGRAARFVPPDYVIYVEGETLLGVSFDRRGLRTMGTPAAIAENVFVHSGTRAPHFAASENGRLVYREAALPPDRTLVWVDRSGGETALPAMPQRYAYPAVSPDSSRVLLQLEERFWLYDDLSKALTPLALGRSRWPVWAPDGATFAFASDAGIFRARHDTGGVATELAPYEYGRQVATSWSRDGRFLLVHEQRPETRFDLFYLDASAPNGLKPFLVTEYSESQGSFSPDGRFVAYTSDESGREEVYVRRFPSDPGKWQVSTRGGSEPVWSPRGGEIIFRSPGHIVAAAVHTEGAFSHGAPVVLFTDRYERDGSARSYDVHPDGDHFLMVKAVEENRRSQLRLVERAFPALR